MKSPDNSQKKEFVYDNIKSLPMCGNTLTSKQKLYIKTIISKIIIVNGNIEIQLKKF